MLRVVLQGLGGVHGSFLLPNRKRLQGLGLGLDWLIVDRVIQLALLVDQKLASTSQKRQCKIITKTTAFNNQIGPFIRNNIKRRSRCHVTRSRGNEHDLPVDSSATGMAPERR